MVKALKGSIRFMGNITFSIRESEGDEFSSTVGEICVWITFVKMEETWVNDPLMNIPMTT
jgi:hypothetical protein